MNKSKVALIRCETYDEEKVYKAVRYGLDVLGGAAQFVKPGEKIVLKPNVLIGSKPEKCVTTHPAVFQAVGQLLKEAGAILSYGDSPAFGRCEPNMRKSGLKQVGDELGMSVADFDSGRSVSHKDALLVKSFVIANGVLDSDGLVSLPKLKTHPMPRFTGAVKNHFGIVPGLLKGQFHVKLPDPYDFCTMLVDLNTLVRPRLCVMDGIMAMEGNGPRGGKPKKMSVLLLSSDPIAIDATASRMIDLNPEAVPTSKAGEKARLGTYHRENIEIAGENIESFLDRSFEVIRTPPVSCSRSRIRNFVRNRVCEKPVIDEGRCNRCGVCVKMCPVEPKAVNWHTGDKSKPPKYKYDRCIRCFCCQENCPEGAVLVESPMLGKIVFR